MRKTILIKAILFCLSMFAYTAHAQLSFLGFDAEICGKPLYHTYTYENYSTGGGLGHSGYKVFRDGNLIRQDEGSKLYRPTSCTQLTFINDSVGFLAYWIENYIGVLKTVNYGDTWIKMGEGNSRNFGGMYVESANCVYLVALPDGSQYAVSTDKYSDIADGQQFTDDKTIKTDVYYTDTVPGTPLCNIDTLSFFVKNGAYTVAYHINMTHGPTGIVEHNKNQDAYLLYPHPATTYFRLKEPGKSNAVVSLLSISGQVIKTYTANELGENYFPLTDVKNGLYLVRTNDNLRTQYIKLLVNN